VTRTTGGRWCLRLVRRDNEVECLDRQAWVIGDMLWREPECRTWHRSCGDPRRASERVVVACRSAVIPVNRYLARAPGAIADHSEGRGPSRKDESGTQLDAMSITMVTSAMNGNRQHQKNNTRSEFGWLW